MVNYQENKHKKTIYCSCIHIIVDNKFPFFSIFCSFLIGNSAKIKNMLLLLHFFKKFIINIFKHPGNECFKCELYEVGSEIEECCGVKYINHVFNLKKVSTHFDNNKYISIESGLQGVLL